MVNFRGSSPVVLMLVAVVGYSFTPLFVAWSGGDSPFLFAAAWGVGVSACGSIILLAFCRRLVFSEIARRAVRRRIGSGYLLVWVPCYFSIGLYALSTQFIGVTVATVLLEVWPTALVILSSRLFQEEARYRKITPMAVCMFLAALVGVALVIAGQSGGLGAVFSGASAIPLPTLAAGVSLGLGAACLVALGACGFKWASLLASDLFTEGNRDSLELFSMILGITICNSISPVLLAAIGLARGEQLAFSTVVYGALGGVLVGSLFTIAWRRANLTTRNLELNAIVYLTPALSLVWLFALSLTGDVDVVYLLSGVALIVAANGGLYLRARIQKAR